VTNTVADRHSSTPRATARSTVSDPTSQLPAAPDRSAAPALPSPDRAGVDHARLDRSRSVLEAARAVIERGWLQRGWYVTPPPAPRTLAARMLRPDRSPEIDDVRQACLVAAVALAADGGRARPDVVGDAGPTLDIVWDAMLESSDGPWVAATGRAAPPEVRIARIRELVRWNDAAGRTRDEVLTLLDRAISRTILTAMQPTAMQPTARSKQPA
jgi:hypothetical protein